LHLCSLTIDCLPGQTRVTPPSRCSSVHCQAAPGVLADVLLCLTSLQFVPPTGFAARLVHSALGLNFSEHPTASSSRRLNGPGESPDGFGGSPSQAHNQPAAMVQWPSTGRPPYRSVTDILGSGASAVLAAVLLHVHVVCCSVPCCTVPGS
jgi:hypothetical protein